MNIKVKCQGHSANAPKIPHLNFSKGIILHSVCTYVKKYFTYQRTKTMSSTVSSTKSIHW